MAAISHHTVGGPGGGPSALHPPLEPCSAEDVASFAALDQSLRSHPDLAKEGSAVLNPEALARLVDGIRTFQDEHLGRDSKSRRWPFVRLPDHIFRDRSRTGPLYAALISAYRTKSQSTWRNFDMGSNRRFDDNVALMRKMGDDLVAAGFLRRPIIHLDETVPKSRRGVITRIVERFGGKVVRNSADATHVVAHDAAIDGDDADWTHALAAFADADGEDEPEKEYVRTMAVVKDPATGKRMTLAHWWFFPASYDIWMPSKEVAGDAAAEPKQSGPVSEDGKWVVASRFVRDVARFNEWGNEADYAIADYHSKVALYKGMKAEPTKPRKKSSNLTAGKKGSKSRSSDAASVSSDFSSGRSKAGESDRKRDRRAGSGMNPRHILTGYYSESGARVRRIVHDGALRVPPRATGIVRDSLDLVAAGWDEEERRKWVAGGGSRGKRRIYELPRVDSLARPSLDSSLGPMFLVTELYAGSGGKSVARNRRVPVLPSTDDDAGGAERIRGGGEGEGEDVDMADASAVVTGTEPLESSLGAGSSLNENSPAALGVGAVIEGPTAITESQASQDENLQNSMDAPSGITSSAAGSMEPTSVSEDPLAPPAPAATAATENMSAQSAAPVAAPPAAPTIQNSLSESGVPAAESAGAASNASSSSLLSSEIPGSQSSSQKNAAPAPVTATEGPVSEPVSPSSLTTAAVTNAGGTEAAGVAEPPASSKTGPGTAPESTEAPREDTAADQSAGAESTLPNQQSSAQATVVPDTTEKVVPDAGDAAKETTTPSSSGPPSGEPAAAPVPSASLSSGSVKEDTAAESSPQSAPTPTPSTSTAPPAVTALPDRPAQKESFADAEDSPTISAPSWYDAKAIADIERIMLPEWFDSSAIHRTPESYMEARERIVGIGSRNPGRYITATAVRRVIPGDAGSLLRLHSFLVQWGFLNIDALGDSAPTLPGVRKEVEKKREKPVRPRLPDGKFSWNRKLRNALATAVVKFAIKQQKTSEGTSPMGGRVAVDWAAVAAEVGDGANAADCQGEFLSLPLDRSESDESMDDSSDNGSDGAAGRRKRHRVVGRREVLNELLDGVRPSVIAEATDAALNAADGNIEEAKKAAVLGAVGAQAMEEAKREEDAIERILMEILDQRMVRLENRVALLDDMEGMLEAERVALELERRDLYTARCRHWYGGGN